MRKFNFLRFLKKSRRGYILIFVVFFIPIIMMGVKWCLDQSTLEQVKIATVDSGDSCSYKKCAKESALAVAQKWNPALTYNGQKESMLRLADEVYNNATAEGTATTLLGRAIPGLEIHPKYKITNKGTLFNPVQVTPYGEAQSFTTEGRKIAYKNDQTADHRGKEFFDNDSSSEVYRRAYFLEKNSRAAFDTPFCDVILRREGDKHIPVLAFDSYYTRTDVKTHTPMSALAGGFQISPYDTDEMSSTIQIRSTPDDPKLKLSVEGDKIKVQVDSDIADDKVGDVGYVVPAECNVDIILTIPTNAAACNKDNADANSTTAGSPSLVTATAIKTTNSKATTASTAGVSDMRKSPIYQIAQAYRTFLRDNFEFTRGVNVGLIPYSGKVSLPPEKADTNDEATCWTENVNSFVWNPTETKVDDRDDYLRGMFLYGASGKSGTAPTTALTKENYLWGGWLCPTRHGGYGILCRNVSTNETHAGNTMYVGDVLSTADPATHKFKRMNYWPCQVGAVNMLNMKCTKDCTQFCHNPYFIVPLTPNVTKIHDLMNAIVPFYDDHNQSNLICIPVTWANNLFQDWAYPQTITASDTEGGGRLSNPKPNSTRKKVLILVVNKPDWFEPCELTYLGFDNDYSEVPMVESDRIDFHTNYSDLTLKYADGSSYDNKIRGQSKILLAETDAGVVYNNDTKYYESEGGTVTLKFPRKALVKVVVEPVKSEGKLEHINSPISGMSYNNLCFVRGMFVVTGGTDEAAISSDGRNWKNISYTGEQHFYYLGGDYLLALPSWSNKDAVYIKDFDFNYIDNKSIHINGLCGCVFAENKLIIFGEKGYISICSDKNGESWTPKQISDETTNFVGAAFGNGKVVAVDSVGYIYISTDSENWEKSKTALLPSLSQGFGGSSMYGYLDFGNGKFYHICPNGEIRSSIDGVNWNLFGKAEVGSLKKMVFGNGVLILMDQYGQLYIYTPPEKALGYLTFSNISSGELTDASEYEISERREFFIEPDQIGDTQDADKNYHITMSLENIRLISAEITNRPYEKKDREIQKSGQDSIDFQKEQVGTIQGANKVLTVSDQSGLSHDSNSGYYECKDGLVTLKSPHKPSLKLVVEAGRQKPPAKWKKLGEVGISWGTLNYVNNKFVATQDNEIYLSDNGASWTKMSNNNLQTRLEEAVRSPDSRYTVDFIAFDGGKYVAYIFGGYITTSSDLSNWGALNQKISGGYTARCCCMGNKLFVFQRATSYPFGYLTNSGQTWTQVRSNMTFWESHFIYLYQPICSDGNRLLIFSGDGYISTSDDEGVTWSDPKLKLDKFIESAKNVELCAYGNGRFMVISEGTYYCTSSDGCETWSDPEKVSVDITSYASGLTFANNRFYMLTSNGQVWCEKDKDEIGPATGGITFTNATPTEHERNKEISITQRTEFFIEADQISGSNGNYTVSMKLDNIRLISAEINFTYTDTEKELVYSKLRAPEKSRVADFSEKSPLNGVDDLTMNEQNYRGYNESTGYWETSTENHVDSNVYSNCGFNISEFRGDFYFLIEDIGDVRPLMRLFNRSKGPNTYKNVKCEEYYFDGLHRRYQDYSETRGINYVSFDIGNAPANTNIRYYMAGFTLPMNSTLYYSYYEDAVHKGEWYEDSSDAEYPDASEAAKNLAKAALAKLAERSDLRIYLIEFRAPAQYKNNMTGKAANFDYTYLEGYATASGGKVYTIANDSSAEVNLAAKLTEIAADIKKFAGYSAAKIEE